MGQEVKQCSSLILHAGQDTGQSDLPFCFQQEVSEGILTKESSWAQFRQKQSGQVFGANVVQMDLRMLILSLCSVAETGMCEAGDDKGMGTQV